MANTVGRLSLILVALAAVTLSPCDALAELDAATLFREGNSLARTGLYRAAILRYEEARERGLDTALLDYNVGVAYYRAANYAAAEQSFAAARREPRLAALAAYNLGLTLRAAGRSAEAREWFTTAADSTTDRNLRALVGSVLRNDTAVARTDASTAAPGSAPVAEESARRVPGLTFSVDSAYGSDDNANRSPADPYVDIAQPGQPTVTPTPISSGFAQVNVAATYRIPREPRDTDLHLAYRASGRFYDNPLAYDESDQRAEVGAESVFAQPDSGPRTLRSALYVTRHRQINVDPDTGLPRSISGVDISQRFAYYGAGIESSYEDVGRKWSWGLDMRIERRGYREVPLVDSYDNDLYLLGAHAAYTLGAKTVFRVGLDRYRREYDDRHSRDLDGALLVTSPALSLSYSGMAFAMTRKITRAFDLEAGFARLDRTDSFVGYDDFTKDVISVRGVLAPVDARYRVTASVQSRAYDFPRAYAFNVPAAGPRELDDVTGEVAVELRIKRSLMLFGELSTDDVTSTDLRAEYTRARILIGVTWLR